MCVIAIKHKHAKLDLETITEMFEANPHGAGFAVVCKKKTIVSKGYWTAQELWADIQNLQNKTLVLHFRLATHGAISDEMCHPFVVDENEVIATEIFAETDNPVIVHNGILHGYGDKNLSDTAEFVIKVLSKQKCPLEMCKILDLTSSLFTVIHKGKIHRVGEFEKYKELLVSNTYFSKSYANTIYPGKVGNSYDNRQYNSSIFPEYADSFEEEFNRLYLGECDETGIIDTPKTFPKGSKKETESI